jgi:hypothetical protein
VLDAAELVSVTVPAQMVLLLRVYRDNYDIENAKNSLTENVNYVTEYIILYPAGFLYTTRSVYCAVRTEPLNKIQTNLRV